MSSFNAPLTGQSLRGAQSTSTNHVVQDQAKHVDAKYYQPPHTNPMSYPNGSVQPINTYSKPTYYNMEQPSMQRPNTTEYPTRVSIPYTTDYSNSQLNHSRQYIKNASPTRMDPNNSILPPYKVNELRTSVSQIKPRGYDTSQNLYTDQYNQPNHTNTYSYYQPQAKITGNHPVYNQGKSPSQISYMTNQYISPMQSPNQTYPYTDSNVQNPVIIGNPPHQIPADVHIKLNEPSGNVYMRPTTLPHTHSTQDVSTIHHDNNRVQNVNETYKKFVDSEQHFQSGDNTLNPTLYSKVPGPQYTQLPNSIPVQISSTATFSPSNYMAPPLIQPMNQSLTQNFTQPLTQNFTQPLTQNFTQPLTQNFTQPLTQNFTQPLSQNFTQPLSQNFTQPLSQNFAQPLSQNFTQPLSQNFAQPLSQNFTQQSNILIPAHSISSHMEQPRMSHSQSVYNLPSSTNQNQAVPPVRTSLLQPVVHSSQTTNNYNESGSTRMIIPTLNENIIDFITPYGVKLEMPTPVPGTIIPLTSALTKDLMSTIIKDVSFLQVDYLGFLVAAPFAGQHTRGPIPGYFFFIIRPHSYGTTEQLAAYLQIEKNPASLTIDYGVFPSLQHNSINHSGEQSVSFSSGSVPLCSISAWELALLSISCPMTPQPLATATGTTSSPLGCVVKSENSADHILINDIWKVPPTLPASWSSELEPCLHLEAKPQETIYKSIKVLRQLKVGTTFGLPTTSDDTSKETELPVYIIGEEVLVTKGDGSIFTSIITSIKNNFISTEAMENIHIRAVRKKDFDSNKPSDNIETSNSEKKVSSSNTVMSMCPVISGSEKLIWYFAQDLFCRTLSLATLLINAGPVLINESTGLIRCSSLPKEGFLPIALHMRTNVSSLMYFFHWLISYHKLCGVKATGRVIFAGANLHKHILYFLVPTRLLAHTPTDAADIFPYNEKFSEFKLSIRGGNWILPDTSKYETFYSNRNCTMYHSYWHFLHFAPQRQNQQEDFAVLSDLVNGTPYELSPYREKTWPQLVVTDSNGLVNQYEFYIPNTQRKFRSVSLIPALIDDVEFESAVVDEYNEEIEKYLEKLSVALREPSTSLAVNALVEDVPPFPRPKMAVPLAAPKIPVSQNSSATPPQLAPAGIEKTSIGPEVANVSGADYDFITTDYILSDEKEPRKPVPAIKKITNAMDGIETPTKVSFNAEAFPDSLRFTYGASRGSSTGELRHSNIGAMPTPEENRPCLHSKLHKVARSKVLQKPTSYCLSRTEDGSEETLFTRCINKNGAPEILIYDQSLDYVVDLFSESTLITTLSAPQEDVAEFTNELQSTNMNVFLFFLADNLEHLAKEYRDLKKELEVLNGVKAFNYFGLNPSTATLRELKKRYHQLSRTMHPDKGGDAKAFQELKETYNFLKRIMQNESDLNEARMAQQENNDDQPEDMPESDKESEKESEKEPEGETASARKRRHAENLKNHKISWEVDLRDTMDAAHVELRSQLITVKGMADALRMKVHGLRRSQNLLSIC